MILVLKTYGDEMGDFFGRVVSGENESVTYTEVAHGHEQEILQNCLKLYASKQFLAYIVQGSEVIGYRFWLTIGQNDL